MAAGRKSLFQYTVVYWNIPALCWDSTGCARDNTEYDRYLQYGGPDGEMSASLRYLSQRFAFPYREVVGVLNDIGREASEMFRFRGFSHIKESFRLISFS